MQEPDWAIERTRLQAPFRTGDITKASRKELEWALVVLAHADDKPDAYAKQTPHFRAVVGQLLHIRISEQLHWRSMWMSFAALVVSIVVAVTMVVQTLQRGGSANPPKPQLSVSTPAATMTPAKTPAP